MRQGRARLVLDFTAENPEIFEPMFTHPDGSAAMELAIIRHIYQWVDSHIGIFSELSRQDSEHLDNTHGSCNLFLQLYRQLCESCLFRYTRSDNYKSHALESLVKSAIDHTNKLIALDLETERKLKMLHYQYVKSKVRFARELTTLLSPSNSENLLSPLKTRNLPWC